MALYLRQSLDRTGERLAVDRQREACAKLAEARGWTVTAEYLDNSVSATNGTRKEWERMLVDAERVRFDVILAWSLDRLTRSMRDTERLVALCERSGIRVATVQGDLDLTTDSGRLVGRILSAVARGEIERKSERQRLANAQAAALGKPPIGPRAIGWEKDGMTVVPHEAELVRRGFELILAGGSLRSVVRLWNAAGLTTAPRRPDGSPKDTPRIARPWAPFSVRHVLCNPRYAGLRAVKGELIGHGTWPAIVAEDTWRAVSGILNDPGRRTTTNRARRYLLTGMARCGVCGAPISAGGVHTGHLAYRCRSGNHLIRQAGPVDEFITELVVERLRRPDAADLIARDRPDVTGLATEATALRTRRDQLAEDYGSGLLTRSQLLAGTRRIERRLAEIEARLSDAAQTTVLAAFADRCDVRAIWDTLDLDQRRAVVDTLMSITLHSPGQGVRTFRPESVEITWRTP